MHNIHCAIYDDQVPCYNAQNIHQQFIKHFVIDYTLTTQSVVLLARIIYQGHKKINNIMFVEGFEA